MVMGTSININELYITFNPFCAETEIFQEEWMNNMPTDSLASYINTVSSSYGIFCCVHLRGKAMWAFISGKIQTGFRDPFKMS